MRRGTAVLFIWAAASLLAALSTSRPLFADGGVTFTDIAKNGGAGINYERFPTPARKAQEDAFFAGAPYPFPAPFPNAYTSGNPNEPRGTPGVALLDYDNDGDLDIYVTNGPGHPNSLFQNQFAQTGQVTFVDVAVAAGVTATSQDSAGVCFGDIDNDGFEDIYVTGIGMPNVLFHNNGNGTFTDITASAGVGAGNFHHSSCAMGDFNGDGYLDIVVGNTYDDWSHRKPVLLNALYPGLEPNQLFMRDPTEKSFIKFNDTSASSGIQHLAGLPGGSLTYAVAAVDFDQDGIVDIMWADLQGAIPVGGPSQFRGWVRLFKNDGTGHFTDLTLASGMPIGSFQGITFGDYNCDGILDFAASNWGYWFGTPHNFTRWFLGSPSGVFSDPGVGGLNATPYGWGIVTSDYDNDGDPDIFFYGDDDVLTIQTATNPGTILQNHDCSANFTADLTALTTDHRLRQVHGVAVGDLNNDGFDDMVTVASLQIKPVPGRFVLFPNVPPLGAPWDQIASVERIMQSDGAGHLIYLQPPTELPNGNLAIEMNSANNGNGAAEVTLLGGAGLVDQDRSNRDGLGATVKFTPAGGKTVITPIVGGASHASQSSRTAHFGLGTAAKGTVDVIWPGGTRNRLYDVASGERVLFPEIPCSLSTAWDNFGRYNSCVARSLDRWRNQGLITQAERQRFFDSAVRAFHETTGR